MYRKSFLTLFISLLSAALFGLQAVAAEDLPASNWYAVLHTQPSDQLVWINATGEQARISRPKMPNEQPILTGDEQILISPDGRYGVLTAPLANNLTGLGFYDFQQGVFVQTHTSQAGETINLGHPNSFLSDMTGIAIAFYTQTDGGITNWRIINFDPKTGNVLNLLQKSDNAFPEPAIGLGAYPYVFYAQDGLGYRFHMIPYAVGGSVNYDAFTWNPTTDVVTANGMITTELDILPTTNTIVEAGFNVGLPSVSLEGPIPILNVITQRNAFEVAPTQMFHDPAASLFSPRWLRNGEWYAYNAYMPNDVSYWGIHSVVGDSSFLFSDITPSDIYGTSEGYLLDYDGQTFIASTELDSSNQPVIFEAAPNDSAKVVYVTPIGSPFTLASASGEILGEPPQQPVANCAGAPEIQLAIGIPSRVSFSDGTPLRVRQEPNGTVITELAEGTEFAIIEGPVCLSNYNWWKMSMPIQGGTLMGWVAEGNMDTYFVEIWYTDGEGPVVTPALPPAVAITPLVAVTVQPPVLQITPLVFAPVPTKPLVIIANPGFVTDGDCSFAVAQYLSVGGTVITQLDGTLAVRDTPTAEFPTAQVASAVTGNVSDGPLCHGGFRIWKVAFTNGTTGWVADSYSGNLYLKKQ